MEDHTAYSCRECGRAWRNCDCDLCVLGAPRHVIIGALCPVCQEEKQKCGEVDDGQ
jgi:hypothetical protein